MFLEIQIFNSNTRRSRVKTSTEKEEGSNTLDSVFSIFNFLRTYKNNNNNKNNKEKQKERTRQNQM